jgi:aspartyl/asparaginyl beta-hydroxylase (cupin superfamily)
MAAPAQVREVIEEIHHRHGREGPARIVAGLEEVRDGAPIPGAVPDQRITFMRVPGLTATPFHDPAVFPWNRAFEAATDEVIDEFARVEEQRLRFTDFEGYGRGWNAWLFASEGQWFDETMARAPRTTALLQSTHYTQGEFLFSELAPGGVIPPHTGGCNAVLSVHLGLVIPPSARIKVGQEVRGWTRGKVVAFDDSFVHGCWNPSAERRICLVWEVWHPELSEVERSAMAFAYQALVNDAP